MSHSPIQDLPTTATDGIFAIICFPRDMRRHMKHNIQHLLLEDTHHHHHHHHSEATDAALESVYDAEWDTLRTWCLSENSLLDNDRHRVMTRLDLRCNSGNNNSSSSSSTVLDPRCSSSQSFFHPPTAVGAASVFSMSSAHGSGRDDDNTMLLWSGDGSGSTDDRLHELMDNRQSLENVLQSVSSIRGPFAFVFATRVGKHNRILFGRDQLGRRSLVYTYNAAIGALILSSVCHLGITVGHKGWSDWRELGVDGIYSVTLLDHSALGDAIDTSPLILHSWSGPLLRMNHVLSQRISPLGPTEDINLSDYYASDEYMQVVQCFMDALEDAVKRMVSIQQYEGEEEYRPRIGVLFSGGIDSVVVAALACKCSQEQEEIDLLNVSFDGDHAADRKQGIAAFAELR